MMSKLSMHWMVLTALGTLATQAMAQVPAPTGNKATPFEEAPVGPPPVSAKDSRRSDAAAAPEEAPVTPPSTSLKDARKEESAGGISVQASASPDTLPPAQPAPILESSPPPTLPPLAPTAEDRKPWMQQFLPTDSLIELGAVVGLLFPSSNHNLQSQTLPHQSLATAPELGVRGAYFPIKYVGAELEYFTGFSKTQTDGQSATTWAFRGEIVGQYPAWRVTPFALLGAGRLGVFSNSMGNDGDPLFHWGVGAKAALTSNLLVRLDLRDNMIQKHGAASGTLCNNFEMLAGVSLILGRPQPPAQPPQNLVLDTDGDGLVDRVDKCPTEAGAGPDGCPIKDSDGDGIMDNEDKCPDVRGEAPDGCPLKDSDGDGIPDSKDKCVIEKGEPPDGCPATRDSDHDGIIDSKDKCPNQPETMNGFEDDDGCPDELPARVKAFTGVIQGIEFDREKASIRPSSSAALDKSAAVLTEYPSLRVLITGHTDNAGIRARNVQLSKDRAEAVKAYLVGKGVAASRIETKGAGPDEPIDSNVTAAGRQRNRRIEFKLIKDSD
jgi:outer membrane protein OmpA-like peptidoglycan-associated protein